jgi:hypothetical protein
MSAMGGLFLCHWHGFRVFCMERNNWRLIGDGEGIHWPALVEEISVKNLILGKPSGERQKSFKRWLEPQSLTQLEIEISKLSVQRLLCLLLPGSCSVIQTVG